MAFNNYYTQCDLLTRQKPGCILIANGNDRFSTSCVFWNQELSRGIKLCKLMCYIVSLCVSVYP